MILMTVKAVEHCSPVSGAGAATVVAPTPPAAAAARAGTGPLQPASSEARSSRAAGRGAEAAGQQPSKRRRTDRAAEDAAGWEVQLVKLTAYKRRHGDCNVPQRWAKDPSLGMWVSTQRRCKRNRERGEPGNLTGMTAERAARLTALGIEWNPTVGGGSHNAAAWEAQLAKLKAYTREHGDCNVPSDWAEDPALAGWVDRQRQCKRKVRPGQYTPYLYCHLVWSFSVPMGILDIIENG